jgi:hypothetical protein
MLSARVALVAGLQANISFRGKNPESEEGKTESRLDIPLAGK